MDDIGETEDIPETDVGAGSLGLVKTTATTIIQKTAWEQTILALQQLGVKYFGYFQFRILLIRILIIVRISCHSQS